MELKLLEGDAAGVEVDLLALPVTADFQSAALKALSDAAGVDLKALAEEERFTAEVGKTLLFRAISGLGTSRLLLVGLGEAQTGSHRRAGTSVARAARDARAKHVGIVCEGDVDRLAELLGGFDLGAYRFDRHLSQTEDFFAGFESVSVVCAKECDVIERASRSRAIAAAVNAARNLVNESPNNLVPETLAQAARDIASMGQLETTILGENKLHEQAFNLIMAVGKGSEHPPRLIHLVYRPDGDVKRKIALVGKGVTFDTGGYNIKPGGSMLNMHCDMAGAAAVLGAAKAIGDLRPQGVEVHFIVPTAENVISHNAFKPMDIFRGYGGKTVEIHNTDAEGRLILADALAYAQEQKVDTIVDLATLTGASVVALGEHTAALFTNDDELADGLLTASNRAGEAYWRMPLDEKMDKLIDTPHADMKNVGPRWGGAITAALFLKRWVDQESWAHLDIAGPAWNEKDDDLFPEGGTGFGVSTLVEYVLAVSES